MVELVAALRAVLDRPELALGVEGRALHVAVAEGEDGGLDALLADEGVVGRRRAVLARCA